MGCLCSKSAKPSIDRALEPRELPGSNVIGCIVELCSNETGGHEVYRTFNGQRYRKIEGRVVKSIYADGAQPQTVPVKLSPNVPTFLVDSAVSLVQSSMEREAQLTMSDDRSFKLQIGRACKGDVMARLSKEGVSAGGGGEVERALRLETRGGEGTVNFELLVPTVELEFRSGLQLGEVGVAPQQRHPTLLPKYIHRVVLGVRAEASITIEQGRREESKEAEAGAGARFTVAEDAIMVGVQCSAGSDTIRHEGPIAKSVSSRGSFRLDTANIVNQSLSHSMDAIEEQAEQAVYQPDQWRVLFVGVRRSSHTEEELEQQCRQAGEELLTLLEDNPDRELDVAVPEHIRRTVTDARRAIQGGARSMLVVGDTDSGKSSLCGLLNGSLHFDEELKIWRSDFAIGNGADALTNNTELRVCSWLGNDGTHNTQEGGDGTQKRTKIVLLDSPGLGDSRGAEVDRQHMDEVAQIVIGVERIHTITVVLKNDDTQTARMISPHLREALAYLQDIFGTAMWDHVVVIVNRWRHDTIMKERRRKRKEQTEEDFSRNFRSMLMQPAPRQAALTGEDGHIGLGLTGEQTSRIRFFFMDTQYERSDAGEAFSMGSELDQLRCHLVTMGLWKAKVTRPCSAQLRDLIFAVQYRSDAASLQEALDAAEAARPQLPDLSREKLDAIRKEIKRRSGIDRVRTLMANGLNAVKNAWDKWQAFSRIHTNCLEPQDAAMQFLLAMSTVTMVFEEVDTEGLTHEFDQRQVAGRPINHVKKELEDSRRLVVNAMNRGEEPTDLRDEELAQSFQVLVHHGKRNKKLEEFIRGVLEEAAIASAGTILRNACQWAEAGGVQTRAEILRRIDDFSKAAGLRDVELERLRTLLEVTQTLEMKAAGDIPLDQLKNFHNRAVEAEMGSLIRRLALMIQTQEEELEREAKLAAERRMAEVAEQARRLFWAQSSARLQRDDDCAVYWENETCRMAREDLHQQSRSRRGNVVPERA